MKIEDSLIRNRWYRVLKGEDRADGSLSGFPGYGNGSSVYLPHSKNGRFQIYGSSYVAQDVEKVESIPFKDYDLVMIHEVLRGSCYRIDDSDLEVLANYYHKAWESNTRMQRVFVRKNKYYNSRANKDAFYLQYTLDISTGNSEEIKNRNLTKNQIYSKACTPVSIYDLIKLNKKIAIGFIADFFRYSFRTNDLIECKTLYYLLSRHAKGEHTEDIELTVLVNNQYGFSKSITLKPESEIKLMISKPKGLTYSNLNHDMDELGETIYTKYALSGFSEGKLQYEEVVS